MQKRLNRERYLGFLLICRAWQLDRSAQHRYAANEEIIRFGKPQQLDAFWVGIMRGDPKNHGSGLVHRSPEISGTGVTRVVFCLDA